MVCGVVTAIPELPAGGNTDDVAVVDDGLGNPNTGLALSEVVWLFVAAPVVAFGNVVCVALAVDFGAALKAGGVAFDFAAVELGVRLNFDGVDAGVCFGTVCGVVTATLVAVGDRSRAWLG
jgi:hypothetical protein